MAEYRPLPAGLDTTPAGPALSALLASIDLTRCNGWQLSSLLPVQQRQIAFEQARLLQMLAELSFAALGTDESPPARVADEAEAIDRFVSTEASFSLTWTEYTAATTIATAVTAMREAPALGRALSEGRLDLPKLKMINQELADVSPADKPAIAAALEPEFARCTVPELRERLRRILLQIDPQAVRARREKALQRRWVRHDEYANGTSSLFAGYLPKDKAAAAWANIDAIATATRSAGDPLGRDIDQLRADVFADLLAGVDPAAAGYATPAQRKGTVNLHIDVTTLACLVDNPGAIEGFGPVAADIARQTAEQMFDHATWRFVTHDRDGSVIAEGRLRYRPTPTQRAYVQARDQTCRAPGCRAPARRCETDHVRDWAHHGPTLVDNLCCLCKRHHRAKHVGGFTLQRFEYGVRWRTPHGHDYTVLHPGAKGPTLADEAFVKHFGGPTIHIRR